MNKDRLVVNAIRILAAEGVQKAKSGHPGMPMGMAPAAYALWAKEMNHNPANPNWINRDRFVLSGGHGSMLLYTLLHRCHGTTVRAGFIHVPFLPGQAGEGVPSMPLEDIVRGLTLCVGALD